jgi:heterodisulfide reductase subunit C2
MSPETLEPNYCFAEELEIQGPFQALACFQCRKCSNGCPVTFAMDLFPDEVIRMVILGQREKVLNCKTIWICSACETCTTRCPNEVRIAELMDHLKEIAVQENIVCQEPQVLQWHQGFLKNIKSRGRVFETTLLPTYLIQSGEILRRWKAGTLWSELGLGWRLLTKGRMPLRPSRNKGLNEIIRMISKSRTRRKPDEI